MDSLRPVASVSPAEAAALRRAFGTDRSRDGGEDREVSVAGDQVIFRDPGREVRLGGPDDHGVPERPTLSADGSKVAWVRGGSIEVMKTAPGFAGRLRRLASWHSLTPMHPARAVDLSEDGSRMAYVSGTRVYVEPTDRHQGGLRLDLPGPEGLEVQGADVEFLPGGRVAVETDLGTYLLVEEDGRMASLPLAAFDPRRADERIEEAAARLPALDPAERAGLVAEFGAGLAGAHASPEGSRVVVQVRRSQGDVEGFLLDRDTGRRTRLGAGPQQVPAWSPDGSFVAVDLEPGAFVFRGPVRSRPLPGPAAGASWSRDGRSLVLSDGRTVGLDEVFSAWELDLGTGLLGGPAAEADVVVEDGSVVIGAVRLPMADA